LIQKAIKRLAKTSGASSLKFFGRILCTDQDYWVAQGVLDQAEEAVVNSTQEARGKGVNATVYWVAHDLRKDWIQLPDCQPE
jgi:radial spoke head protein 4A